MAEARAGEAQTGGQGGGPTTVATGVVAGVAGGVAMVLWLAASAAAGGDAPLAPLWPLGDALGAAARGRSAATFLLGMVLHLAFAGGLGIVLAAIVPRDFEPVAAGVVCTGLALLVMAAMTTWVLPAANPTLQAEMPAFGGAWVIAHGVYGFTTGAGAQLARRRGRAGAARSLQPRHA